jgi:hypothetical protein
MGLAHVPDYYSREPRVQSSLSNELMLSAFAGLQAGRLPDIASEMIRAGRQAIPGA